jgi:hypothetical protein
MGIDVGSNSFHARKAALARLLRDTAAGILINEYVAEDGTIVFAPAYRLGAEGILDAGGRSVAKTAGDFSLAGPGCREAPTRGAARSVRHTFSFIMDS